MSRKKEGSIRESIEELHARFRDCSSHLCEPKLRMLMLLKENPLLTTTDVAGQLGCCERTVRRWWKRYQQRGLKELLGNDERARSVGGTSRHLTPSALPASPELVRFVNSLPVTDDTVEWIERFRDGLKQMLGDVDRISVNVDTECRLYARSHSGTEFLLTQHLPDGKRHRSASEITTQRIDRPIGQLLLEDFQRHGFPVDCYHPPHYFDYQASNGVYIGSIFLWRECQAPEISRRTVKTMATLEPFLVFLLSDCVERRRRERPDMSLLMSIVDSVSEAESLTSREREVLLHHLLGKGYQQISGDLYISVDAVRKHVKSIHRKTGTHTFTELFARYFTPLGR